MANGFKLSLQLTLSNMLIQDRQGDRYCFRWQTFGKAVILFLLESVYGDFEGEIGFETDSGHKQKKTADT